MNFLPENISTFGHDIDNLTVMITWITMTVLVIAEGILFYLLLRFRRKEGRKASYINGIGWKQVRWVLIPVMMVAVLDFIIDEKTSHAWQLIKQTLPTTDYVVRISSQQFSWNFTYPGADGKLDTGDDIKTANALYVPLNKKIVFELQARDVLHSFWVPALRLKQDAVPGRTIRGWFEATKTGEYEIACAELCGAGHSLMKATLHILDESAYDDWQLQQTSGKPAAGAQASLDAPALLQAKGCLGCHSTDGSARVGPSYKGIYGRQTTVVSQGHEKELSADEAYLKRAISAPQEEVVKGYQPLMPSQPDLSEAEIAAIVAYLKELK